MIKAAILIVLCIRIAVCQHAENDLCSKNNGNLKLPLKLKWAEQDSDVPWQSNQETTFRDESCSSNCSQLVLRIWAADHNLYRRCLIRTTLVSSKTSNHAYGENQCLLLYSTSCFRVQKWKLNHKCDTLQLIRTDEHPLPLNVTLNANCLSRYYNHRIIALHPHTIVVSYDYIQQDGATRGSMDTLPHDKQLCTGSYVGIVGVVLILSVESLLILIWFSKKKIEKKAAENARRSHEANARNYPPSLHNDVTFNEEPIAHTLGVHRVSTQIRTLALPGNEGDCIEPKSSPSSGHRKATATSSGVFCAYEAQEIGVDHCYEDVTKGKSSRDQRSYKSASKFDVCSKPLPDTLTVHTVAPKTDSLACPNDEDDYIEPNSSPSTGNRKGASPSSDTYCDYEIQERGVDHCFEDGIHGPGSGDRRPDHYAREYENTS